MAAAAVLGLQPATPAGAAPAAASALPPLPRPNSNGLTYQGWVPAPGSGSGRAGDLTVTTSAVFTPRGASGDVTKPVKVRILLPAGYQTDPAEPYDVLYLLHGGRGDFEQWSKTDAGNVEAALAGSAFKGIVVMPEGGKAGWYSDWAGKTDGGFAPLWETFHIKQLVPYIDANFNTKKTRSGRAVAGASMGGYGALRYAGRHPDLFSAVGTFSGGTDIHQSNAQKIIDDSMWVYGAAFYWTGVLDGAYRVTASTQGRMETVFGPSSTWPSLNPVNLALDDKYAPYTGKFAMYAGTGETDVQGWNQSLHADLNSRKVTHEFCTGTGTHDWKYWVQDLKDFAAYVYGGEKGTCPHGWGAPVK
ncbi:alpha/beta hydrolase [Streptomyces sp. NPDC059009]|uniref:alpha/beta hydrolase n=1 Tax=Streptomyces sp. NPDC059009 TaxID=3346694 RepID=UPI00368B78F9